MCMIDLPNGTKYRCVKLMNCNATNMEKGNKNLSAGHVLCLLDKVIFAHEKKETGKSLILPQHNLLYHQLVLYFG